MAACLEPLGLPSARLVRPLVSPSLPRRYVGRAEVLEALRTGKVNARKSAPQERPCPKYVVDATVGPQRKNVQASVVVAWLSRGRASGPAGRPDGWRQGQRLQLLCAACPLTPRPPARLPAALLRLATGRVCGVPARDPGHHCHRPGHRLGVRALLTRESLPI